MKLLMKKIQILLNLCKEFINDHIITIDGNKYLKEKNYYH